MLTQRQEKILSEIIKEYTNTATPVSSDLLLKKAEIDCSSATVRNEMAYLEDNGYLVKPHISAGRIPSDLGYRYFVDRLMSQNAITKEKQQQIQIELLKLKAQNARMARTTAKLLSTTSKCLAVSGIIDKEEYFDFGMHTLFSNPEFSQLDEISRVSSALDLIDENIDLLLEKIPEGQTEIFIGKENPIKEIQNCSMVVSPYRLESGERAIVAIIGPKRMKYGKNKSLIDFVKKIMGTHGTAVSIVVIIVGSGALILSK